MKRVPMMVTHFSALRRSCPTSRHLSESDVKLSRITNRFVCCTTLCFTVSVRLQEYLQRSKSWEDTLPLRLKPAVGYSIFSHDHKFRMTWKINYKVPTFKSTYRSEKTSESNCHKNFCPGNK